MNDAEYKEQQRQLRRQYLNDLSMMARGFDRFGNPINAAAQVAAIEKYEALRAQEVAEEQANQKIQLDGQRVNQEGQKVDNEYDIAQRKLDIEQERVAVQKAEVMVKALEVAAKAGLTGERLLEVIQTMNDRLIPMREVLQLEEKK